jgi:hypothetical protein
VENERLLARAGDDEKKKKRIVRKKPPEGQVSWTRATFERLENADPEPLVSSFRVTHALVLNVIARPGDAFAAMRHLLETNDEPRPRQRHHIRRAISIFRALLTAGVVEKLPEPDAQGRTVRIVEALQLDFALNQPLSPFALAAFDLLDRESPSYMLDLVSVIESTLESPRAVIGAQEYRARGEAVNAMKAEGIEYEERMELLEEVTHPRPLAELLEPAYEIYRQGHPWVGDYELRPKSVIRDLYERAMTFVEYVGYYNLARSEGIVLRYLADAYRALRQTVPDGARTEEVTDLIEWLGELVRQVDSSLLTEWEQLRSGADELVDDAAGRRVVEEEGPPPVTRNVRAFRVLVRNALFRRVELFALHRWGPLAALDAADAALDLEPDDAPEYVEGEGPGTGLTAEDWHAAVDGYFAEYPTLGTGPDARGPKFFHVEEHPEGRSGVWLVRQVFDDPEGDHDWGITAEVDLAASDRIGAAALTVTAAGPLRAVSGR